MKLTRRLKEFRRDRKVKEDQLRFDSFHRFLELPLEIRIKIYKYALPPRTVRLTSSPVSQHSIFGISRLLPYHIAESLDIARLNAILDHAGPKVKHLRPKTPGPALLNVSHEARSEALKSYTFCTLHDGVLTLPLNLKHDTLQLGSTRDGILRSIGGSSIRRGGHYPRSSAECDFFRKNLHGYGDELKKVRFLMLSIGFWKVLFWHSMPTYAETLLLPFQHLEKLRLLLPRIGGVLASRFAWMPEVQEGPGNVRDECIGRLRAIKARHPKWQQPDVEFWECRATGEVVRLPLA